MWAIVYTSLEFRIKIVWDLIIYLLSVCLSVYYLENRSEDFPEIEYKAEVLNYFVSKQHNEGIILLKHSGLKLYNNVTMSVYQCSKGIIFLPAPD